MALKVLLLGGTGMVGSILVKKLVASEVVGQVTCLSRRQIDFSHDKLKTEISKDFESYEPKGFDLVINCLGTTRALAGSAEAFVKIDHDIPLKIMKAHSGPGIVLLTASNSDANSYLLYPRTKGLLEKECVDLKKPYLAIVRPGLLLLEDQVRPQSRFFESVAIGFVSFFGIKTGMISVS